MQEFAQICLWSIEGYQIKNNVNLFSREVNKTNIEEIGLDSSGYFRLSVDSNVFPEKKHTN